uniref:Peptidase S1 domain-containing protein n=1 Tax=Strigops habroptila TaxID=2489341 RepID=A0A672UR60_STRHB
HRGVSLPCGTPVLWRVVGGSAALPGQWPWQVSVTFRGTHVCGGALIIPRTARNYRVTLGTLHLLSPPPGRPSATRGLGDPPPGFPPP